MKNTIKIYVVMTAVLLSLSFPMISFGAAEIKFRHVTSIYSDDRGIGISQPEGVACNETSTLIVADTQNGRLLRYNFQNSTLESGATPIKVPQLLHPAKTQMNSKGEIYVLDRKQDRIIHLTSKGGFKGYVDPIGLSPPQKYAPRSFTLDEKDNIYILDIFSQRVLVLNPEGKYQRHIQFPEDYGFFSDIAVDFRGSIFLIDSINAEVFSAAKNSVRFSPLTGRLKQYMRFPTGITTDSRGRIYLVDRNGSKVIILGQDGTFLGRLSGLGWKEGHLDHPSDICINSKGEIFIADTSNNRIQVFSVFE
ncbi:MAG: NHL repeat-containing protein [Desulfobacterales bacterium]|nr:NHL repeat-containing protein [Desulfobacterales bacterium]